jgi:ssDNA-binding Zn-finger/Zn-ribbon topoisomerase 1
MTDYERGRRDGEEVALRRCEKMLRERAAVSGGDGTAKQVRNADANLILSWLVGWENVPTSSEREAAAVDGAEFVPGETYVMGLGVGAEPPGVGTCETCSGTGWTYIKSAGAMGDVPIRCPDCAGVQSIREEEVARPVAALAEQAAEPIHYPVPAPPPPSVTCQTCGGPGLVRRHGKDMPYERCPTCKGTGKRDSKGAL